MLAQLVVVLFLASVSVNSYVVNPKSIADLSSQEETTVFVNNTESLVSALNSFGNRLLIVYIARLVDNQYTYLFSMNYERLIELLKPLNVVHLMVGVGITEESDLLREVLVKIPDNSMFVLDGEPMQYCVCSLASLRNLMGHPPPVIIHTEQETPWIDEENDIFAGRFVNGTNCHNSDIALVYHSYKHIFRTYYYRPLVDIAHVTYLPLGPAATSYTRQFSESHPMVKASERTFWCMFTGRIEYGFRSKHHYNRGDLEFTLEHLKNTVGWEDDPRRCSMLYGQTDQNRHVMNHDDYHLLLSQTAFIPCPSGNSPETFRHYEVCSMVMYYGYGV